MTDLHRVAEYVVEADGRVDIDYHVAFDGMPVAASINIAHLDADGHPTDDAHQRSIHTDSYGNADWGIFTAGDRLVVDLTVAAGVPESVEVTFEHEDARPATDVHLWNPHMTDSDEPTDPTDQHTTATTTACACGASLRGSLDQMSGLCAACREAEMEDTTNEQSNDN